MVCELAQQEAFNKMCVKKIEKLRKKVLDLQDQLNEESEQRLKNKECWESVQKKYQELHNEDLIHLLHIVELKKENEKLKKENKKLKEYHKIGKLLGNVGKGYKPVANRTHKELIHGIK
jgi:hypothetical protein